MWGPLKTGNSTTRASPKLELRVHLLCVLEVESSAQFLLQLSLTALDKGERHYQPPTECQPQTFTCTVSWPHHHPARQIHPHPLSAQETGLTLRSPAPTLSAWSWPLLSPRPSCLTVPIHSYKKQPRGPTQVTITCFNQRNRGMPEEALPNLGYSAPWT